MNLLNVLATLLAASNLFTMTIIQAKNTEKKLTDVSNNSQCSPTEQFWLDKSGNNRTVINNTLLKNSIVFTVFNSKIIATFAPRNDKGEKISLKSLATTLGYQNFNWVNYVETDPYGISDHNGALVSTPYNDPPPGGYQYETADEFPFYWDIEFCEGCRSRHHYQHPKISKKFELTFEDNPSDYRLKAGESINFVTHLVGVRSYNKSQKKAQWDILKTFRWQLTNSVSGKGQVSLIAVDIDPDDLPLSLLSQIRTDGGFNLEFLLSDHNSLLDSPQCQL